MRRVAKIIPIPDEKEKALCCGGSIGDTGLSFDQRVVIRDQALAVLTEASPDMLITACPLCKKTFRDGTQIMVKDIAELVAEQIEAEIEERIVYHQLSN